MIVKKTIIGVMTAILLTTSVGNAFELGVLLLDFVQVSEEQFRVDIHYADCSGYSVIYVDEDERLYRGEKPQMLDEYLPSNRIKITLGDCEMSERVKEEYSPWQVYDFNFEGCSVSFMWCYNNDHGVNLYIASDSMLRINERAFSKIKIPIGKISIDITVD